MQSRLPHGRFRSGEKQLEAILLPRNNAQLEFQVRCDELPGTIVENAFLILQVLWPEEPWRILARLRVIIGENGAPETITELITTQRAGFAATMKEQI